jgi:signal peptidase I
VSSGASNDDSAHVDSLTRPAILVCGVAASLFIVGCGRGGSRTYTMPSSAMEPTIHCGRPGLGCEAARSDEIVVESFDTSPERGDILVFETPPAAAFQCGARGKYVKRVIGLPGETVAEKVGFVYIGGKKLNEPYVESSKRDSSTYPPRKIASDHYFVMGDNRSNSCDSRHFGAVPRANITGRVVKIRHVG